MFVQGMHGMIRRMYNGGATYAGTATEVGLGQWTGLSWMGIKSVDILGLNVLVSHAAWFLGLAQLPFIINFFWSMKNGRKAESDNPWQGTTLEWQAPNMPPHGNFTKPIQVHRGPYEYSVPKHATDFTPQNEPEKGFQH
jgi:cytochrome c oxidase subunit 1